MRQFRIGLVAAVLVLAGSTAWADDEPTPKQSKIKIGVLHLEAGGADKKFAVSMSQELESLVEGVGFYDVYSQTAIEDVFNQLKEKFPKRCYDPRCVRDVGRTAGMDRMIFGSIEKGEKSNGVRLWLVDVQTKQVIESVSLAGEPGAKVPAVLAAAVQKIHGRTDEDLGIKVGEYFGPEVHNEKQMIVSSGICMGLGVIWALASGGFSGEGGTPPWEAEYDNDSPSGLPTSAYHIPLFARPAALANSYLAVSDDAYSVMYNPAGMAWVGTREVALGYQYRFGTLNNVALSYVNKATREIGFGQAFLYSGDELASEVFFVTALAYKFNRLLPFLRPLSVGGSLKLQTMSCEAPDDNYATAGGAAFGLGVDLGLLWELSDQIRYGAVFKDLLSFKRYSNTVQGYDYAEFHPVVLNMGGVFKAGYTTMLVANGQIPLYSDQPWKMAGGVEQELFRVLKLRVGIEKEIQAKVSTEWKFTGGVGVNMATESVFGKYVSVDAAYEYNTLPLLYVFNVSMKFGF